MNFDNILNLVKKEDLRPVIRRILEFEHSNLHLKVTKYSDFYNEVIEEAINENKQD